MDLHVVTVMRFLEFLEHWCSEKQSIQPHFFEKYFVEEHSYQLYNGPVIPLDRIRRAICLYLVELIISMHLLLQYGLTKLHFEQE